MQKQYVLFVVTILIGLSVKTLTAQTIRRAVPKSEEPTKDESLATADKLYKEGYYQSAISYYQKVVEVEPNDNYSYYQMAEAYRTLRYYIEASQNYNKVLNDPTYPKAMFWYAKMLKANGKYDEAKNAFQKFIRTYEGKVEQDFIDRAKTKIEACDYAGNIIDNSVAKVSNAGGGINQSYSDFSAIETAENKLLFASAEKIKNAKKEKLGESVGKYDSSFATRIFEADKDGGQWNNRKVVDIEPENPLWNVGSPCISSDNKRLYYTICQDPETGTNCNIYYSEINKGKYGKPVKLPETINQDPYSSKHPYIVSDMNKGEVLFFASNRPGGQGGFDLYLSKIDSNKNFSNPLNLGSQVNTQKDEKSPFYDTIDNNLFFSSNGHLGLGEFDIYMVNMNKNKPKAGLYNVGYPINSSADDYYFTITANGKGYLSSNRPGGYAKNEGTCCDDIYSFQLNQSFSFNKLPEFAEQLIAIEEEDSDFLLLDESFVYKHLSHDPENLTFLDEEDVAIFGSITDEEGRFQSSKLVYLIDESGNKIDSTYTDENGNFEFKALAGDQAYMIMMSEEDADFIIEMEAKSADGKSLKKVSSEENLGVFQYRKLAGSQSEIADIDEEDVGVNFADFLDTEDEVTVEGTLTSNGKYAPNTAVYLTNSRGEIVDSAMTDANGNFEFKKLSPDANYMIMMNEEDADLFVEMDFLNERGEALKTVNSENTKQLFTYNQLKTDDSETKKIKEKDNISFAFLDEFKSDNHYELLKKMQLMEKYKDYQSLYDQQTSLRGNPDFVYKIQIGAYKHPKPGMFDQLSVRYPIKQERVQNLTKFVVGNYGDIYEIEKDRIQIYEQGILDAFIAVYYKGKRITTLFP